PADHATQHLSVERRHDVDVRVLAPVREVGDAIALRRDRRRGIEAALVAAVIGETAGEMLRVFFRRHGRPVALAQPLPPLLIELLDRDADAALERAIEA